MGEHLAGQNFIPFIQPSLEFTEISLASLAESRESRHSMSAVKFAGYNLYGCNYRIKNLLFTVGTLPDLPLTNSNDSKTQQRTIYT
jgi:hypothetical protein